MKKFRKLSLVTLLAMMLLLTACSGGTGGDAGNTGSEFKNVMFVVTGSLGGGTNNDDVYEAVKTYTDKVGGNLNTFEANMDTSLFESTLMQAAASKEYDLIITGFGMMIEPLGNTAAKYPDQKFFIFNTEMDFTYGKNANVISVQTLQNEGGFMAGVLAAQTTLSDASLANADKKVGFVGAIESTAIIDFLLGYIDGVNYVDPSIEVVYSFVGNHTDSALAKEMGLAQYQQGVDVIFAVGGNGKDPHLLLAPGDIAPVVLLPGDPGRVEMFIELCDDFKIVASNREYKIGTGTYQGHPVSVCSTGIGAASAEIAIVELIELGAKALIRIGGTGVNREDLKVGDMVITTGSMRQGGSSQFYAPLEYPAVASFEVVSSLIEACESNDAVYTKGIGASIGSFFAGQGRIALNKQFHEDNLIEQYQKLNVINMEMEAETLMTLGNVFGVLTGAICAIHANRVTDEWLYDFASAQRKMCQIALDSVVLLYEKHL